VYLALADGAARFRQDFTGPALLRIPASPSSFAYGAITRFGRPSHAVLLAFVSLRRSYNPKSACTSGLGCSPFARHYLGNHCCSLFLPLLRCFSSQRLPLLAEMYWLASTGCPIRTPTDRRSSAAPRGFSQLGTSFIASECLGIHRVLFLACSTPPVPSPAQALVEPAFLLLSCFYPLS
jgi:hypothetical protein